MDYRIDDLQYNGLRLMQDPAAFCFGCDAVELANFASIKAAQQVCELGAGNGIISVLLAAKKGAFVTAVEIQSAAARLCQENAGLNSLQDKIQVKNECMLQFIKTAEKGSFDAVISNPPYQKAESGQVPPDKSIALARCEIAITLAQVVECAAHLAKFGGKFFMVYPAYRLAEALSECTNALLEPKVLQLLTPDDKKPPHLFLLECINRGKKGLTVLPQRQIRTYV